MIIPLPLFQLLLYQQNIGVFRCLKGQVLVSFRIKFILNQKACHLKLANIYLQVMKISLQ